MKERKSDIKPIFKIQIFKKEKCYCEHTQTYKILCKLLKTLWDDKNYLIKYMFFKMNS